MQCNVRGCSSLLHCSFRKAIAVTLHLFKAADDLQLCVVTITGNTNDPVADLLGSVAHCSTVFTR
jgi:hypothetical protein